MVYFTEKELQTLIPPIQIEPDSIDKPGSHLGTGPSGQLIVHPRSSFTLHCLYPDNIWGLPVWNVTYMQERAISRDLIYSEGKNKLSLTISAAEEGDSGIYKCLTPFGVQHALEVEVKGKKLAHLLIYIANLVFFNAVQGPLYRNILNAPRGCINVNDYHNYL